MKRLLYVAFGIVIVLFSCNKPSNTLEGKWNIVNITQNDKDTLTDLTIPLVVLCMQNDGVDYIEFTKDNEYNLVNNENVVIETKKYSIEENLLNIEEENGISVMEIIYKQADLVDLKSQDKIIVSLKRIEE
ncbi:MAG: DUF5004 domain-containing protein [Bacteroidales bacterium]|nr:DUF5004 domain-containing protein [Bacteroidales bacterium]MDD4216518.1 DUF5004 domain-containing protein [Bacteroidales bacterium]MDY0141452.1 DUF5004 domain-containing protein [Bacteroidales bacterium]